MTNESINKRLVEDVVIFHDPRAASTGAQAIEPGHRTRGERGTRQLPAKAITQPSGAAGTLQQRVEQFLFHQSELLDGKHWQAYIDLFAANGVYWMPVMPDQADWIDTPSIFAEDVAMMQIRMGRVTHPNAWSQVPAWGTSHVIGNVVIETATDTEVHVRSRFHMMELRRDVTRHFAGTYRHTLRLEGEDFRITLQRVDLLNGQAPFDYVLQIWV